MSHQIAIKEFEGYLFKQSIASSSRDRKKLSLLVDIHTNKCIYQLEYKNELYDNYPDCALAIEAHNKL